MTIHRLATQLTLTERDADSRSFIYLGLMDEASLACARSATDCFAHVRGASARARDAASLLPRCCLAAAHRPLLTRCTTRLLALQVEAGLQAVLQAAYEAVGPPCVTGLLSMRLQVEPDGGVSAIDKLVDTLVVDPGQLEAGADGEEARDGVAARIIEALSKAKFDKCDAPTQITIPFTFD